MIATLHLFRPLNQKLVDLLRSLSAEDWNRKTVAGNWTVKDVTAHLLDTNMRFISIYRDHAQLRPDRQLNSYADVVGYLNQLNADWVTAMKRVSAQQLIDLHVITHEEYIRGLENLDPNAPAMFNVAWAGEDVSPNWFHIARDFTEKWHHQQQIRDAVNRPGILTTEFYRPVLDTFMKALPFRYSTISAPERTLVNIVVESSAGGSWWLIKDKNGWIFTEKSGDADVMVSIPAQISWRLFTKAIRLSDVKDQVLIKGEEALALPALQMITVMA
jgi:uncharacterized protein (TIGR03083 family)